jgi:hypothetical protein
MDIISYSVGDGQTDQTIPERKGKQIAQYNLHPDGKKRNPKRGMGVLKRIICPGDDMHQTL